MSHPDGERSPAYVCRLLSGGTGSAALCLGPMIRAWGERRGLAVVPGTLNLCADRPVVVPAVSETLASVAHMVLPPSRRGTVGYSPRLYPVMLAETQRAWLYRWSEPAQLRSFVGDADSCHAEARCEVVAGVRLRDALHIAEGDTVTLRFNAVSGDVAL